MKEHIFLETLRKTGKELETALLGSPRHLRIVDDTDEPEKGDRVSFSWSNPND